MSEHSISFERNDDGKVRSYDPRRVPAGMMFTTCTINNKKYVECKIAGVIGMNESAPAANRPYVLEMLILPKDARAFAQGLLDADG